MTILSFDEWKEYLLEQGIKESEITDIIHTFNISKGEEFTREAWTLKLSEDAEKWFNNLMDEIACAVGDIGEFLKLHMLDYAEFADEYTTYLTDDGDVIAVYCQSTDRVLIFEEK